MYDLYSNKTGSSTVSWTLWICGHISPLPSLSPPLICICQVFPLTQCYLFSIESPVNLNFSLSLWIYHNLGFSNWNSGSWEFPQRCCGNCLGGPVRGLVGIGSNLKTQTPTKLIIFLFHVVYFCLTFILKTSVSCFHLLKDADVM